ncbi:uncharacterized protein LOC107789907 [Nicotiana tabacum]|uniref:Uncharacterized protein LOC107789907 n=2 Tax=Nicotiana tabacum TaxID=4097 RepID=A0AC58RZA3_TOBAC|nr:PREDICTED: uncharacterized protein LOC107789907 [Nicotiana tabacum]
MDSHQLLPSNQVRYVSATSSTSSSSSLCTEKHPTCSKAQNCLFKILRTISTIPPENTIKLQSLSSSQLKESEYVVKTEFNEFPIDLNVGFCASPENQESESPVDGFTAAGSENSGEVGKCSDGECEVGKEEKLLNSDSFTDGGLAGADVEILEISQLENINGVSEIGKVEEEKGFMGLLIEAARLIFGEFKDEDSDFEPEPEKKIRTKQLKRRNKCWGMEYVEETADGKCSSPVVRSKRGRIQMLPCKYRDSIIEPLTRFSRNRSSIVANRRPGLLRGTSDKIGTIHR